MINDVKEYHRILYDKLYKETHTTFLETIIDPAVEAELQSTWQRLAPPTDEKINLIDFIYKIHHWIETNPLMENSGLSRFENKNLIPSTFDALNESFIRYKSKRFRHLHGEYAMVHMDDNVYFPSVKKDSRGGTSQRLYIDNENGKYYDLDEGDWVLLSLPFYPIGDHTLMYDGILNQAQLLDVPVIIDCSLFPYTENIKFNFDHPAITEVVFNISLGLSIPNNTVAIRYSNHHDGLIQNFHINGCVLDYTMTAVSHLMDFIPSNYFAKKCSEFRDEICHDFGFTPTNVVSLCLASYDDDFWFENESIPYPTVNISKALTKKLQGTYNVK